MTQAFVYKLHLKDQYHNPENWDANTAEVIQRHFEYLSQASKSGKALLVGRTDVSMKENFGIVIFQGASEEDARSFMNGDPCIVHGVMRADVYPFRLVLWNQEALAALTPSS